MSKCVRIKCKINLVNYSFFSNYILILLIDSRKFNLNIFYAEESYYVKKNQI